MLKWVSTHNNNNIIIIIIITINYHHRQNKKSMLHSTCEHPLHTKDSILRDRGGPTKLSCWNEPSTAAAKTRQQTSLCACVRLCVCVCVCVSMNGRRQRISSRTYAACWSGSDVEAARMSRTALPTALATADAVELGRVSSEGQPGKMRLTKVMHQLGRVEERRQTDTRRTVTEKEI